MNERKEKEEEIMIRLVLNPNDDQPIYNYFMHIKNDLGLKSNTEVVRLLIKKYYQDYQVKEVFAIEEFKKEFKEEIDRLWKEIMSKNEKS